MAKKTRKKSTKRGGGFKTLIAAASTAGRILIKALPPVFLITIFGLLVFGVRTALYADPNLTIQKIVVEPADALAIKQREKLEAAFVGKNIFKADIESFARHLQKDPNIENARILKKLPSEIRVEVLRRKPFAYVRFSSDSRLGVVSEDGMILDTISLADGKEFMIEVNGLPMKEPTIGYQIRHRGFQEAIKFLTAYQEHPLSKYESLSKIKMDHLGNLSVYFSDGPEVRLGRRASERLHALEKVVPLLENENRKKIDYVDVQFDNVIVKQKKA